MSHPHLHAVATPDKIGYRMAGSGATLTYAALEAKSNQASHALRALGLPVGGHVALFMENCLEFLEICWAAQRSGLYYTAISRFLKSDEVAFILADSGATVLLVSPATWAGLAGDALPAGVAVYITGPALPGPPSWTELTASQPVTPIADQATEDILVTHEAVMDVAVFGVPDEEFDERVHAVVQPVDFERAGPALAATLIAYCESRLSKLKCPTGIDFAP